MKPTLLILAAALASVLAPAERIVPNDPYFKHQVSFLNTGGRLTVSAHRSSHRRSPSKRRPASTRISPGPGRSRPAAAGWSWPFSTTASFMITRISPATSGRTRANPARTPQATPKKPTVSMTTGTVMSTTSWAGITPSTTRTPTVTFSTASAGTGSSRIGTASRPWASSGPGATTASAWRGSTGMFR